MKQKNPGKKKTEGEPTQLTNQDSKPENQVTQPVPKKAPPPSDIGATVRQEPSPGLAETIPTPKVKEPIDDIAETIAASAYKDEAEIQAAEKDVPAEWEEGDVILGLYQVEKILGQGGFGRVYKVRHKGWNIELAVKSPLEEKFKTDEDKKNFEQECQTWIDLGLHPNTVSCYYVRRLGGIPRVFAEYIEGGSLKDWIEDEKKEKTLEKILDIAIQFAWGLQYAHEKGLVHQDVKPANVMMTNEGEAKVTDFGLAKARAATSETASEDQPGQSIRVPNAGFMTREYASPEQAAGKALTRKTDIWSWGLSVLEMFAGEVFWRAGQVAPEALESFIEMGAEDDSIPKMPDTLVELLRQCFQQNPDNRPGTVEIVEGFKKVKGLKEIYKEKIGDEYPRPEPKPAELLADGLNNKAVSMLDLGREEEAENIYEEALKTDPHHPEATYVH